ncbi:MAG TPA: ATP phosphoribosyltransferase [Flavobacterium sp.]|jgi:ATP phosphoribosyltransferase|uniref:ATP phosphoribosyltransferase n=3 Tax=Flavobacterium TaxID=237 RepID=A0A1M7CVH9_9FLAO|nr:MULTISPECIES: ATP phosphoribosyltransferase [Flavobacterium]SDZ52588.1 ATP phosphoribosyltransferase [Flavobacterium aquidurense]HJY12789.1 ATP phosphoribosyltransferase [Flavobacterium sp.]MBF4464434.1 ATP phosphoribosyltransferase [Flavobacterium sp. LC2016-12]MCA1918990.1 ATP phosphoribosyltransferase [Flavobacterium piscis]OCB73809.1 ATP phosphoribosyltransferase [Flavobacterium piscis]
MSTLKIAIQKSGRLNEDSIQILKDCGISINNGNDQLKAEASNFPLEVLYLRNSDIPQYLIDGVVDLAIVGDNLLVEKGKHIEVIQKLGFSKCKVSVAVPKTFEYNSIQDLAGLRIATSYPNTVNEYFNSFGLTVDIHQISGSVEIAPNIGLADAIVDIVSSGSTLFKNNLREVEVILKSEAVLAVSPKVSPEIQKHIDTLKFRIQSVLRARNSKYILMNVPNDKIDEIGKILPVLRSLTVLPLAQEGWSSVHSVIDKDTFWDVIDKLKEAGAEGILVCPIEKMVL